jgi:hypothetical protein
MMASVMRASREQDVAGRVESCKPTLQLKAPLPNRPQLVIFLQHTHTHIRTHMHMDARATPTPHTGTIEEARYNRHANDERRVATGGVAEVEWTGPDARANNINIWRWPIAKSL